MTLEPALVLVNEEIFVYNVLQLFLGKQSVSHFSVRETRVESTTGKGTYIFYDVFISILDEQSVSHLCVRETRSRSTTITGKLIYMFYNVFIITFRLRKFILSLC